MVDMVTVLHKSDHCSVRRRCEILLLLRAGEQESVTFVLYFAEPQLFASQRIYRCCMYNAHANRSEAIVL